MRRLLLLTIFLSQAALAQNPCEYSTNVVDSLGSYKATKDFIFYEKNFGGTSSYLFFSLVLTDGLPTLNTQFITKSKDFIKAYCFDKNSKMYLQLANGKVVTLIHMDSENCGTSLRGPEGMTNRVHSGIFMFLKDSFEDLKSSPVTLMRIRYAAETVDYIVKSELVSEMDGKTYKPETYFMDTLKCITD